MKWIIKLIGHGLKQTGLGLLLGLFCLFGLWAEQEPEYISTASIAPFELLSRMPEAMNSWSLSSGSKIQSLPYKAILAQSETNWSLLLDTEMNYETETDELSKLLSEQMSDLKTLKTQWTTLQMLSRELRDGNRELTILLQESGRIIDDLGMRLEAAMERVTDAEGGAIALLIENAELFNQARLAIANISILQQQLIKAKQGAIFGFAFGGISFGIGTPLVIEGVRQDNTAMIWSGIGVAGTGTLIWAFGHYIFHLW